MAIFEQFGAVQDIFREYPGKNPANDPVGLHVATYRTTKPTGRQMDVVAAAMSQGSEYLKKVGVDVESTVIGDNYADIVFPDDSDMVLTAWIAAPYFARFDNKAHVRVMPPQKDRHGRWVIRFVREDLNIDFRAHTTI
jgi:hypothetical protein